MKNVLIVLIVLFLIGCAKSTTPSSSDMSPEVSIQEPSLKVCEQIQNDPGAKFAVLTAPNEILVLDQGMGYSWDLEKNEILPFEETEQKIGPFCNLLFTEGALTDVVDIPAVVPKTCGGAFQPTCPQVQPAPYVCGPHGQVCY